MAAFFTGERLSSVPVSHAMSKAAFTIGPETRIEAAEDLMRSKQIRRLPVVQAEKLVGMLTRLAISRARRRLEGRRRR
jgi:CBS domain-containing protein